MKNVSPEEWQRILRRSELLQWKGSKTERDETERRGLALQIRLLGDLPADGSQP
jgi:hypothetical protein